jgi:hypothetical protein
MTKTIWIAAAVAAMASGAAAVSAAQPAGPYIGLLAGSTNISREVTDDYTFKTDKFTWGAVLGWQLHPNLAIEAGYLKPKNITESANDGTNSAQVTAKFSGWTATAVVTWPLSDLWSVHARLGAVRATEKYSATVNGDSGSFSDDTTEILYGAGVGVMVEGARVRLDYQRAKFNYGKVGILSLGINWFLPNRD